ncbi:MAG: T9SS type A sorting domain-containing protein [Lewinellaceae bacterium]|nr:T9SS type A sorting domain-containing protein [Lewinellaceae bacterium]
MKKYLFALPVFCFFGAALFAQPAGPGCLLRLDSIYYRLYDDDAGDYRPTGIKRYWYDAQYRQIKYVEEKSSFDNPFQLYPYLHELTAYPAADQRTILHQQYDTTGGQWKNTYLDSLTYAPTGLLVHSLGRIWDDATQTWVNNAQFQTTLYPNGIYHVSDFFLWNTNTNQWDSTQHIEYNADGNITYLLLFNNSREINTYDGNGQLIETLKQKWTAGAWQNQTHLLFAYDDQQRMTERISQNWIASPGEWRNLARIENQYLNDLVLPDTAVTYSWSLAGTQWNASQIQTYEVQGDTQRLKRFLWNVPLGIWRFSARYDSIFDNSGQLKSRYEYRGDQQTFLSWVNFLRREYTYTNTGKKAGFDHYIWDDGPKQWKLIEQHTDGYFPDDSLEYETRVNLEPFLFVPPSGVGLLPAARLRDYYEPRPSHPVQYQYYDQPAAFGAGWEPSTFYEYYYSECSEVSAGHEPGQAAGCVFPNPFYPGNTFFCETAEPGAPLHLQVFDWSGRAVADRQIAAGKPVAPDWPSGLYVVRLSQKNDVLFTGAVYFAGD